MQKKQAPVQLTPAETKAAALGYAAFHAGKMCVPHHDLALIDLIKANDTERLALCKVWLTAWRTENAAAPVPELD